MTASPTRLGARIDMTQPLLPGAPRLVAQWGEPLRVLQADDAAQLQALLIEVEALARAGAWCVGGLRYEAASALNDKLVTQPAPGPLAWFGVYAAPGDAAPPPVAAAAATVQWQSGLARAGFDAAVQQIHQDIADGRVYQVNLTHVLQGHSDAPVDGAALFGALQQAQPGGYALWADMGDEQVLSVSPELFFDWHQPANGSGDILTRPMKGTARRGATPAQDAQQAEALRSSVKERAENVMIVDLLRNDLGQMAETGSVQVPQLFAVQALPSVWQMTSDVQARLPEGTTLLALLQALFPCGSITGAPKRSAMQVIAGLEATPRGWYCGALGVVRPDGAGGVRATFNVPIRTVVLQGQQLQCGIGSGITADAQAAAEWQEWRYKRAFVERVSAPFALLETLALEDGQLRHQPWHLQRLAQAAQHFGYPVDAAQLQSALHALVQQHPQGLWRVRLQLQANGGLDVQAFACPASPAQVRLQWASAPLAEAHGEFVRFKTTRRDHYERWAPHDADVFDTLLWNEEGELTECTRGNIAALLDGRWTTPPLACGLLPGVGRAVALAQGRLTEGVITVADAPRVTAWAFVNSLRGWLPADVLGQPPAMPAITARP